MAPSDHNTSPEEGKMAKARAGMRMSDYDAMERLRHNALDLRHMNQRPPAEQSAFVKGFDAGFITATERLRGEGDLRASDSSSVEGREDIRVAAIELLNATDVLIPPFAPSDPALTRILTARSALWKAVNSGAVEGRDGEDTRIFRLNGKGICKAGVYTRDEVESINGNLDPFEEVEVVPKSTRDERDREIGTLKAHIADADQIIRSISEKVMPYHPPLSSRLSPTMAIDNLIDRAERAEKQVEDLRESLRLCSRFDKTVYKYRGRNAPDRDGRLPGAGARWNTPREIAKDALAILEPKESDDEIWEAARQRFAEKVLLNADKHSERLRIVGDAIAKMVPEDYTAQNAPAVEEG